MSVKEALKKAIRTLPSKLLKTITWDQGGEMGRHVDFTIEGGTLRQKWAVLQLTRDSWITTARHAHEIEVTGSR